MKIKIEVIGTLCNTWPTLIVEINKNKIFENTIKGTQTIELEYDDLQSKSNAFVIGMINKKFGANGVWDTKSKNNEILEDKTIKICSLKLDDVECKELFGNRFYVKRADRQPTYFPDVVESQDTMNYNGYFAFTFDLPLYNSLINKKYKVPLSSEFSYFSNYTKVFHYDDERKVINSIKDTLKEIDEKFSDKRSQIRNS